MKVTPEHTEKSPTLGPAIKTPKPAPAPVPVAPGIVRNPDGKLSTDLPDPPPVWHPTPYGLPAFESAMDKLGQHVTDHEYLRMRLVESRGGCNCCISPPCAACVEPLQLLEAEALGIVDGDFGGLTEEEGAAIRDALGYVDLPAEPEAFLCSATRKSSASWAAFEKRNPTALATRPGL